MILTLAALAAAAGGPAAIPLDTIDPCIGKDGSDIVVCGKPGETYRIDPKVLEADRLRDAPPPAPTPEQMAAAAAAGNVTSGCVGQQACKGDVAPLVGMALTAAKAAALAAEGEDWREAIRTQPDQYQAYRKAKQKRADERKVRFGVGARR